MNKTAREEIETLRKEYELCYGKKANKYWSRKKLSKCVFSFYVLANVYKKKIAKIQALVRGYIVRKNKPKTKPSQLPMDIVKNILLYRRHPVAQIFVNEGQDFKLKNTCIDYRTLFYYTTNDTYICNLEDKREYVVCPYSFKFSVNNMFVKKSFKGITTHRMNRDDIQSHIHQLRVMYKRCFQEDPPARMKRKTMIKKLMSV